MTDQAVFISIVIPVYNSQEILEKLYKRLVAVLQNIERNFEIIMVDDASYDSSFKVMQGLHRQDPRVKIIRLSRNQGQHQATLCGLFYSQGRFVVTMDDDLQNPPEEIPRLLEKIQEGYQVVFGIPGHKQHVFYRNWGSRVINYCLNRIYPWKPYHIRSSSFRIMDRELVEKIIRRPGSRIYMAALIFANTHQIANLDVVHLSRPYGKSNYNLKKSVQLALTLVLYYSFIPLNMVLMLWQGLFFVSMLFFLWTIIGPKGAGPWLWAVGLLAVLFSSSMVLTVSFIRDYFKRVLENPVSFEIAESKF
ncbi:glycosyltransferase family 2 protein [Syntrophomonas erecta]